MPNKGAFRKGDPRAGRPKGRKNDTTLKVEELARNLIDREYLEALRKRLIAGKATNLEPILWAYAFGKPKETIEHMGSLFGTVTIVMPDNARAATAEPEQPK